MRVTLEDLITTLTLCIIMIFIYSLGYVGAAWSVTIVAIGLALLLFKCRLELFYITENRVIYQSRNAARSSQRKRYNNVEKGRATAN